MLALRSSARSEEVDCQFCTDNIKIEYKNKEFLRKFITSQFKIATSRRNKVCNKHQRELATAVKNARYMALIPYTRLQVSKRNLSK
ncbi:MAG: 30S ribosomal protein S18 [Candidatus Yanofskybacteria bacterium RIFCSPHIGHO2_01_FULL_39_44]|uniref:Small ribosomal subunit protein bS18 n=1 Tax=Candidatus Yanofskybacteria bacterium RIFCSPHIGHO2_02_FULL_43_22 TaxID=1802681 RepID=A0A1F8FQ91_9BACT|nr:MAG: 30S ribosomal protein S18 [Candidatus Yanofskybacteria bacterium RIFCSPHIGHO2_01_FULL_39_44]OGN15283.1 MAG: 30S ribosomal protein S18 [Candidatus Yanofskybacteria bacterium RIFCSPHIGHO2_02_FULL_43_22]